MVARPWPLNHLHRGADKPAPTGIRSERCGVPAERAGRGTAASVARTGRVV